MGRLIQEHPPEGTFCALSFAVALADLGLAQDDAVEGLCRLTEYLALHPGFTPTLSELYSLAGELPGCMKKQIRRAIQAALENLAFRGNRNPDDPIFTRYTDKLFRPWQLKLEMQYLKDGIEPRGRPSVVYFIRGLAGFCKDSDMHVP